MLKCKYFPANKNLFHLMLSFNDKKMPLKSQTLFSGESKTRQSIMCDSAKKIWDTSNKNLYRKIKPAKTVTDWAILEFQNFNMLSVWVKTTFIFFRDYISVKNQSTQSLLPSEFFWFDKQLFWGKTEITGFPGFATFQNLTAVWFKINVWWL